MNFENSDQFITFKHIKAKSPEELEKMMLQIQVDSRMTVVFTAPSYVEGKWYTWYNYDHSQDIRPQDKLKLNKGSK